MSRDYAKKSTPAKKPPKKRAATTKTPAKTVSSSNSSAGIPGWIWFLTGLLLGFLISFLTFLGGSPSAEQKTAPKTTPQAKADKPSPTFDFYQLLKENEVIIEEDPVELQQAPKEVFEYMLQAGSFRNLADADRLRAKLILLNLNATTESVKGSTGTVWHRVLVGPYTNRSKLAKAKSTLAENELDFLLLKRKPK